MIEEDQYVTKDDLDAALRKFGEWITDRLINEMSTRFGEVNQRLDRIDATLVLHGERLATAVDRLATAIERLDPVTRLEQLKKEYLEKYQK